MAMPQFEKRRFRPALLISRLEVQEPWLFQAIDHRRSAHALADRDRARWQYLTTVEAEEILAEADEAIYDVEAGPLGPVHVAGLAAWRMTQGVFRFAPELEARLLQTPINPVMQGYVMARLPQWCVYVESAASLNRFGAHGFWAFVEAGEQASGALHLLIDEERRIRHVPISLNRTMALGVAAAIRQTDDDAVSCDEDGDVLVQQRVVAGVGSVVEAAATLLTYLCCSNANVGDRGRLPRNPMPVRAGVGWAMFPADRPSVWKVGHAGVAHTGAVTGAAESGSSSARFEVRDVVRKGGLHDQDVLWVGSASRR